MIQSCVHNKMKCALFSLMSFPAVLFQISRDSKLSVYIPV